VLPDANLLGVAYSEPTFNQQIAKLLPFQQYDSISPRSLTRRFVVDLLGTRIVELGQILALGSHQRIKERICTLLPEAQEMFDQGWGSSVYPGLLTLAYLFEIARFTQPKTASYYQACFALHAVLLELIHTPILALTMDRVRDLPDYLSVFAGFSLVKIRLETQNVIEAQNPLPSARSIATALNDLANDVLEGDCCSVIRMHELLFSLSNKDHQGLRQAAEEYVGFRLMPRLNRSCEQVKEALAIAGISEGCSLVPILPDNWSLSPAGTALTNAHFRVLQPLTQIESDPRVESWDDQIEQITSKSAAAAKARRELADCVGRSSVNAELIAQAAGKLNGLTSEVTALANRQIGEISNVLALCTNAQDEWNALAHELALPEISVPHLSEGATDEDKEMLEMALEENQSIRAQLKDAQAQNHVLHLKADAMARHQANSYSGTSLDPVIVRKAVRSPSDLTPVEVLSYIQHVGGPLVNVLPSAWRSAEESSHFELCDRMLDLLNRLVFEYTPSLGEGKSDAEARDIMGASYSAKESETVELNPALRSERTFMVGDQEHYFCRHLHVGNDPGRVRGMRIYFDILGGVVTIAYAGKHLNVASTN
jgi:hypothetical protein